MPVSGKRGRAVAVPRKHKLTPYAARLLAEWQRLELPHAGMIVVAVSGGADSVAQLLGLDELVKTHHLSIELLVAHLNHGLRGKASNEDAEWVQNLAQRLGFACEIGRANVKKQARDNVDNLEQAARRARYEFLSAQATACSAKALLTAHTLDDQAETVLLNLLRGSGAEGLSGMEGVRAFDAQSALLLARPLLSWARRADNETYCRQRRVRFRVDEMNRDERFSRVRVRKQLLPLMQSFNGRIVEALARTAELLRADARFLNREAEELLLLASVRGASEKAETEIPLLCVDVLAQAPAATRRRALRKWIGQARGDLRRFELIHVMAVEKLLSGSRGGRLVEIPGGFAIRRKRGWLEFVNAARSGPRGRN
jgi:tRNA(Ile)-lysidine synthase